VIFVRYNVVAYLPDMLAELVYGILARLLPVPDDLLLVDLPPQTAAERIIERRYTGGLRNDRWVGRYTNPYATT